VAALAESSGRVACTSFNVGVGVEVWKEGGQECSVVVCMLGVVLVGGNIAGVAKRAFTVEGGADLWEDIWAEILRKSWSTKTWWK